jgi:hypothetical protein
MNCLPKYEASATVLYHESWSSEPQQEFPQAAVHAQMIAWSIRDPYKTDLDHITLQICDARRDEMKESFSILQTGYADHNSIAGLIRTVMLEFNILVSRAKMEIGA